MEKQRPLKKPALRADHASRSNGDKLPASTSLDDMSKNAFMGTMLGMSWQLAVAVLVPTLGGYQLDLYLRKTPLFTLIGLLLAIAGMIFVVRRAITDLNKYMMLTTPDEDSTNPKENTKK